MWRITWPIRWLITWRCMWLCTWLCAHDLGALKTKSKLVGCHDNTRSKGSVCVNIFPYFGSEVRSARMAQLEVHGCCWLKPYHQVTDIVFQVLFREQGILSFFHAGKMTTHRVKIPCFHCGYFQPRVPCLFVWAGRASFYFILFWRSAESCAILHVKILCFRCGYFQLMCACVCATMHVKILHFRCSYSRLMCVCVCVCATQQESCENSAFLLQLFPANVCVCVCHIACENSAFSLRLFPAYVFRVLFREWGIKAVFSCWDFWVPNCAKIPRICCSRCQPTVFFFFFGIKFI